MYYKTLVKIPTKNSKVTMNKRGNTTYIEYTYDRKYNAEKKYNVPLRTTIGKMSAEDKKMMYPNPNFEKYFPTVVLPECDDSSFRSSCVKVGAYIVIKKIAKDYKLSSHLESWDERGKGLLLDLASYSIITESNVYQHYPEYAYNHPLLTPKHKIYSDSTISRFLSEIEFDQRLDFLNSWNEKRNHNDKIYISYDSTNKSCKAGDIEKVEYGHPKNDVGAPILNYSIAYDMNNQVPLLYETYPGSIIDVSQLKYLIDKIQGFGYKNLGFVLDRGYFSKANINHLRDCKFDYVIMVKGMASFVHNQIEENKGKFELKRANLISEYSTYGMTIESKLYEDDTKNSYFHLFFKDERRNAEIRELENRLRLMASTMDECKGKAVTLPKAYYHYYDLVFNAVNGVEKFFGYKEKADVVERELNLCGYFAIVTSAKMTAQEALRLYKNRDESEKLFLSDKSFLGSNSLRVSNNNSLEAKIFIEFIALIIRNKIYTYLKKRLAELPKRPNYMSVPTAIKELEKIEIIRQPKGHYKLDHAITAKQKVILGAFGLDEKAVINEAVKIGKELEKSSLPEKETDDE